jgi:hypothetical protein
MTRVIKGDKGLRVKTEFKSDSSALVLFLLLETEFLEFFGRGLAVAVAVGGTCIAF